MKIIFIAPSTIPSETANSVQVMKVCQAMTQLGHITELVVPGKAFGNHDFLKHHYGLSTDFPIRWIPAHPSLRKVDFAWKAVQYARMNHFDIIYTRVVWVSILALFFRKPTILHMHGIPTGKWGPVLYRLYLSIKGKKLTVFTTLGLKRTIEEELKVNHKPEEALIVSNGVDLDRYQNLPSQKDARKILGLPDRFTAVYTGGFYSGRGLEIIIDLAKAFPDIQFVCVGGKPDIVQIWKNNIQDANVKNLALPGFVANEQLPLYQASADILLMPSGYRIAGSGGGDIAKETSPMKLFEYMASGRAILCSDLPVLHEVLNEKNACFYPPEDLPALIAAFSDLLNNDKKRESLGQQAKLDVVKYSWNEKISAILSYFKINR